MRTSFLLLFCTSLIASQPAEEENLALRRIADFWQEGEYQIAKHQIEEFITLFPGSLYTQTLKFALGDLFVREKNYLTALQYYGEDNNQLSAERFLNRMHCLHHLQWHATLADECEAYLQSNNHLPSELQEQIVYLLTISLYHQSLNSVNDPELLAKAIARAEPYFARLAQTKYAIDVAEAHAHLHCLRNHFEGASSIYLQLAQNNPESQEFLFQAALLQAKHDKVAALGTFRAIAAEGGAYAAEAAYNELVLQFDEGLFAQIIERKDEILQQLAPDRQQLAHLIFGKSFLALKAFSLASNELRAYLKRTTLSEMTYNAFFHLAEAAFQANDLELLDEVIAKLQGYNASDSNLTTILLSRAQLLKKLQLLEDFEQQLIELLANFTQFPERAQTILELTQVAQEKQQWHLCHTRASRFLEEFPHHDLALSAWHYLAASSYELAKNQSEHKEQFISDVYNLLQSNVFSNNPERNEWILLLTQALYETNQIEKAITQAASLLDHPKHQANAETLLALCHRDTDTEQFITWAEKAISHYQTLLPLEQLHIGLFNAYFQRSQLDSAYLHLKTAFKLGASIQTANLLWLADRLYDQTLRNSESTVEAISLLEQMLIKSPAKPEPQFEVLFFHLAQLTEPVRSIQLLDILIHAYEELNNDSWALEAPVRLFRGELALMQGDQNEAVKQFYITANLSPTKRDRFAATAALHLAQIELKKLDHPTIEESAPIAAKLKDLSLQRVLENEPVHLEAALSYIDLQMQIESNSSKKCALLKKMKQDFEACDDLLAKDYHAAREQNAAQNELFLAYMQYIEAEILLCSDQKELQAKGKDLLIQLESQNLSGPILERINR